MGFIWYIIIGIVAGFLAGKIMRGGGFGLVINLLLGILGGVLGQAALKTRQTPATSPHSRGCRSKAS